MRYVMVPVPSEFVLDVMRMVLFRTPEDDDPSGMRDQARMRAFLETAETPTQALLELIADASVAQTPLRLVDAAEELDLDPDVVRAILKDVNKLVLGGERDLVQLSAETAVGVHGNTGKILFLVMRPEHARFLRARRRAADQPSA